MNKIIANLVNSLLAGALVLLGACANGAPDTQTLFIAGIAALIVAISQFKDFWGKEEIGQTKLLNFINL
jgi:hypothetical protein